MSSSNKISIKNEITYNNSSNSQLVKLSAEQDELTLLGSAATTGTLICGQIDCTGS